VHKGYLSSDDTIWVEFDKRRAASFKAAEKAGRRFYGMYSTCLFCHSELGANEAVEHFPVGRRLAFDAAKGRLWVVCRKCERWNLTPVEERWEAIEECERSFRDTKLRVSTDQIGMSRLSEGLELVRIGKPLRPEFAAWRYGDQFGRRRRRTALKVGAGVLTAAAMGGLGPAVGLSIGGGGYYLYQALKFGFGIYERTRVVARVRDAEGKILFVRTYEVDEAVMLRPTADKPWGLRVKHRAPEYSDMPWWRYTRDADETEVRGDDAMKVAMQLLPRVNQTGASADQVKEAVALATKHDDPSAMFERAAKLSNRQWEEDGRGTLAGIEPEMRLALEMASHEESERRAMEGELSLLEDAWREAEEIAAISDDMFLPTGVSESLAEIKDRVQKHTP
jgi:hypothetical protein